MQKALSVTPGGRRIYDAGQLRLTGTTSLHPERLRAKLRQTLEGYRVTGLAGVPTDVLEVGTGWFPVPALAFWLAGSDRVVTTDVAALADADRFAESARFLAAGPVQSMLSEYGLSSVSERLELLSDLLAGGSDSGPSPLAHLRREGFEYDVAPDWHTRLEGTFAFTFSNNVFEHVDRDTLRDICTRLWEHTSVGGCGFHFIDLTDHFAHSDPSIDTLHFLRYSNAKWRLINSSLHYQSRLRLPDYMAILEEAGFTVTHYDVGRPPSEVVERARIHPEFGQVTRDEAAVTRLSVAVARPAGP